MVCLYIYIFHSVSWRPSYSSASLSRFHSMGFDVGRFFFDPIKTRYPKYNTTVNLNDLVGEIMEWKWESYFLNHGRSSEWCSWGRCKESQIIKMLILSKFCMRDAQTLLGVCRYVKSLQIPSLCVRNTNLSINSALQRPPLRVLQDSFCLFLGKQ